MTAYPDANACCDLLHRAGCSLVEVRCGSAWCIDGTAEGTTQAEAWHRAAGDRARGADGHAAMTNKCRKSPTGLHRWSIAYKGFHSCIDCGAKKPARQNKHKKRR